MQVNMELDKHGVALTSYFPRRLVQGRPQLHISQLKGHDYLLNASCPLPDQLPTESASTGLVQPSGSVLTNLSMLQQPPAMELPVGFRQTELELKGPILLDGQWQENSAVKDRIEVSEEAELLAVAA